MAHDIITSMYKCNAWPATFQITESFLQKLEWTLYWWTLKWKGKRRKGWIIHSRCI